MRIAYVSCDPGVPIYGTKGCAIHVQEVLRAAKRLGHTAAVFGARRDCDAPADLADIPYQALPKNPKGDPGVREQASIAMNATLGEMLDAAGPFDLVYERYSLWSHAGMAWARANGIPGVLEVNAPLIEEQAKHRDLVHADVARQTLADLCGSASVFACVSQGVADYMVAAGAPADRTIVVPNGVDPGRFAEQDYTPRSPVTVGFVGTLKPWHGVDRLLQAASRLDAPEHAAVRLLIVGDGPERESLTAQAAEADLDVHFTGAVAMEEIPGLLAQMDIAVAPYPELPSFYFSPLKLFEYMAAGLPVVASAIGQIPDVMTDGEHGLLCPAGDVDALAATLDRLAQDPALRERMGRAGRARVMTHHTWDQMVDRIIQAAKSGAS